MPRFQNATPPPPPPLSRSRRCRRRGQKIEQSTLTKLFLLRRQPCVHVLHHPAHDPELLTATAIATTVALRLILCRRSRNRCCWVCGRIGGTWHWLGSCGKRVCAKGTGGQGGSAPIGMKPRVRCRRRCCTPVVGVRCSWACRQTPALAFTYLSNTVSMMRHYTPHSVFAPYTIALRNLPGIPACAAARGRPNQTNRFLHIFVKLLQASPCLYLGCFTRSGRTRQSKTSVGVQQPCNDTDTLH